VSAGSTIEYMRHETGDRRQDSHFLYAGEILLFLVAALYGGERLVSRPGHFILIGGNPLSIRK